MQASSSIAVAIDQPAEPQLRLSSGRYRLAGVLELPVFCYGYRIGRARRLRPLQITAASFAETICVLLRARAHGMSPVVLLIH